MYAHSPPLPHSSMQSHAHSSGGQSVYVVPSHSYSPPSASFQRVTPSHVSHVSTAQSYHSNGGAAQPHSPTHAGAFRPFKPAPLSPPSVIRPGVVYSFPATSPPASGSPSSPPPAASSSQPTILIHPSSYSPSAPYPRLMSSPTPHSPVDAVVRPLAVRRTGSPPLPPSALLTVPLTSQAACPTCSQHSHPHSSSNSHSHSSSQSHPQLHSRSLSGGPPGGFVVSSGPQYHSIPHPQHHQSHPSHHQSHRLSPACIAAGCTYPVSPRADSRMLVSDDDDAYSHHSQHSHLSLPSSSSSSSHSIGQPRYSSGPSSFIPSSSSAPPTHPHYVVAGSYGYSPPVAHSHLQVVSSHQPGRVGLPSHVQYGAPPPGTAYTVQSIPIATLSPQSASPSSASSTSSTVSGPFPSAASSTSAASSSASNPSSPRAKSKRSASHMREFVRNYFLRNSASLVNKDLTSISSELQAAYEKETSTGEGAADNGGDRKPVFCRTFIQKVARSLGFILTLHFGLVDKRMKHLMKIRKRGKKNSKKVTAAAQHTNSNSATADKHRAEAKQQQQRDQHIKHEQSQAQQNHVELARVDVGPSKAGVEDDVAAAAHLAMEEMAAAVDARVSERAAGSGSGEAALIKEEWRDEGAVDDDDEAEADDDIEDDESENEVDESGIAVGTAVDGLPNHNMDGAQGEATNTDQAGTKMDV